ncbi:MAG: phosphoesterase [Acidimicrobiaceae bacterium]|nr:phosphoesterase [Acidimicrobiaceae bacterium]
MPRTAGDLAGAPIAHVIEIMLENHTFDDLFGRFPGANGIPVTASFANPLEPGNAASRVLPLSAPPNEGDVQSGLDNSRSAELKMMDRHLGHGYAMDGYTLFPGEGLSSVTTFPAQTDPNEQYLASHFELADRNFQPAIGPTLPNVLYALSGTSHGYLTNAVPGNGAAWSTIFDELSAAGRSSRIYTGVPTSLLHGTVWDRLIPPGNLAGIAPETQFFSDLSGGRLPGFSLLRPGVGYSEEPPEDIGEGDAWLGQIVDAVAHSRYWSSTAIFITYDEGGGFWDHVSPPIVGPDGYGTRTPMVIVSPLARGGVYAKQTTNLSILAFMASLWRLPPLNALEAKQNDLSTAFDFHRRPLPPPSLPVAPSETIGFYGPSTVADVGATGAGQPLTANLQANSRGLSLESKTSARIALTVTPPAGVGVPPHFPSSVELVGGKARLTVTFPVPGYYRILASGPGGILGWLTVDVAVNPDTT